MYSTLLLLSETFPEGVLKSIHNINNGKLHKLYLKLYLCVCLSVSPFLSQNVLLIIVNRVLKKYIVIAIKFRLAFHFKLAPFSKRNPSTRLDIV